jgi:hypothetical protein
MANLMFFWGQSYLKLLFNMGLLMKEIATYSDKGQKGRAVSAKMGVCQTAKNGLFFSNLGKFFPKSF